MKKYYKVAHTGVTSIPKSKELTSYGLDVLLDSFIHWKYEDSWFTDEHVIYGGLENNATTNQLEHISKIMGVLHSI